MATQVTINLKGLERATKSQIRKIYTAIARSNFKEQLRKELIIETMEVGLYPVFKQSTIKHRKSMSRYNNTHSKFRAAFSNLTFTGDLLNSIKSFYVTSKNQFRFIFPKKAHKPYKKANSRNRKGKSSTMEQIYDWQTESGRNIQEQIIPNKSFLDRITRQLIQSIRKFINH